ncbi:MAG: glycosyltransferase family 4 protein [Candidatus Eisenbacteria bacterium]
MRGFVGLRVLLVGPVPPPDGGMANQTAQLARLLRQEGAVVELVAVNAPYRPRWAGRLPGIRAFFRLIPFLVTLWRATARADLIHVMANSGWSWHLGAAPAIWIASWRRLPVVLNYRGGGAADFFRTARAWVRPTLARCSAIIVPSPYLQRVFGAFGFTATVVPNVVDLDRFAPEAPPRGDLGVPRPPHLFVARHLESIYGNDTALRAFRIVRERFPGATMSIAGSGAERASLEALADELGLRDSVDFTGRVVNAQMAALYGRADLVLNPSLVDNTPNSILEALASGVPVVSTNVGGIPDLVEDGVTAALVDPRDHEAMAHAAIELLSNPERRRSQVAAGLAHAARFSWSRVRETLAAVYGRG